MAGLTDQLYSSNSILNTSGNVSSDAANTVNPVFPVAKDKPIVPNQPINPPPEAPIEEQSLTTSSNKNIIDNVQPDIATRLKKAQQGGLTYNAEGKAFYSDGTQVSPDDLRYFQSTGSNAQGEAGDWVVDTRPGSPNYGMNTFVPMGSTLDTVMPIPTTGTTGTTTGTTGTTEPVGSTMDNAQQFLNDQAAIAAQLKAQTDATTRAMIQSIQDKYDRLIRHQQDINKGAEAGQYALLLGAGAYRGSSGEGIMQLRQSYGLQQIADLQSQETDLINQTQAAADKGNWEKAGQILTLAEAKRKEKQDAADKVNKKLAEDNRKLTDQKLIADTIDAKNITNLASLTKELSGRVTVEDVKTYWDSYGSQMADTKKQIGEILTDARKNGATGEIISNIMNAKTLEEAINAAGDYAQTASGIAGEYLFYRNQEIKAGRIPVDFNTYQNQDANRKAKIAGASATGLDSATLTKVQTVANQFDSEQAIKNYQTSAEAIDAVKTLGNTPTDDINRIYAFAKVMDPNSVVREGEYASVQEYSTAVLERYGLKAKRVFDNAGFLTDEARKFLLNTLENRLKSSQKAYDNIYSEYGRRIDKITGAKDGKDYLTDYSKPFVSTTDQVIQDENTAQQTIIKYGTENPDRQESIKQMRKEGKSFLQIKEILGI